MATENKKVWTPNETQKDFMKILKENPDGITLKDIELKYGKTFKTGSLNTLLGKELVDGSQKVQVKVDLVYKDVVIGNITKEWTLYKLTELGLKA